jgi:glutamate racemase
MDFDVKMIVVACNTASSLSLDILKRRYDIPLIGVIEPGARRAASLTNKMKVGVIGTKATVSSGVYEKEVKSFNPGIKVISTSCPLFVPLVEEGWLGGAITKQIAKNYLGPIKKGKADVLILGCTHYPLLKPVIQEVMGSGVLLVDSAKETAKEVKKIINENAMQRKSRQKGEHKFYVSDELTFFKKIGSRFLGRNIDLIEKVEIELRERYVRNRSFS